MASFNSLVDLANKEKGERGREDIPIIFRIEKRGKRREGGEREKKVTKGRGEKKRETGRLPFQLSIFFYITKLLVEREGKEKEKG